MFVPDLSSRQEAGHSRLVLARTLRLHALSRLARLLPVLWLAGCSAESGDAGLEPPPSWRDWVMGGQTGALMPPCGLTPSAAAGDSIPGGRGGIVLHTESCAGLAAAELQLHDEDGMMVSFEIERLPGGALLLRPASPLRAGVYRLTGAGLTMEPVIAVEPAQVPTRLGQLLPEGPSCGANFALSLDPLVLEYLPQLKLSVSVDGGPVETWFDYGTLAVEDGRATLSLEQCSPNCLNNGSHSVRVTAELAGETATLEPIDVTLQINCPRDASADDDAGGSGACGVAVATGSGPAGRSALRWGLLVVLALIGWRRRVCRACGPGMEPPQRDRAGYSA
jgi:hypothetical protein